MIDWHWNTQSVPPADILSAAATLRAADAASMEIDLLSVWTPAERYMKWARDGLSQNDERGWDMAVCYAKRAACRQIDAYMVNNHLSRFTSGKYPKKIDMLFQAGLQVPSIITDLVIKPRNGIEHEYRTSTAEQARRAVELAALFLGATSEESKRKAVISFGGAVDSHHEFSSAPGNEFERIEFGLKHHHSPLLVIDVASAGHQVMMLYPRDEERLISPLEDFSRTEAIQLASILRQSYQIENPNNQILELTWYEKLKQDLRL